MDSQGSKTGRLLSKAAPLEVVADQSADGSYEIRVERGGAPAPEVVVVRADTAAPAAVRSRKVGVWLVVALMVATGLVWLVWGRGGTARPTSLQVEGAEVPGPAGEPAALPPEHSVPPIAAHEAVAVEAADTSGPVPPSDPLQEPGGVPLSATAALGVAVEPEVAPTRAVLPAEAEPAPEAAIPEEEEAPEEEPGTEEEQAPEEGPEDPE